MARNNEYDPNGCIILRDTEGTIISMYRFMELVLGPNSHPWAPPDYWGGYSGHKGYDFGAPAYSEVRCTCTGKVVVVYGVHDGDGSMGNAVCVEETGQALGATVRTHRFMHFVEYPSVKLGETVQQGTLLGYVGTTGQSSGTHLHYDVTTGGPWGPKIDAWRQYNHSSEPPGWTPEQITIASGSPWGTSLSWDVIGETTGINYGPGKAGGGSSIVPKTFFTDKQVFDVSATNLSCLSAISPRICGGLIIQLGVINHSSNTIGRLSAFKQWVHTYEGKIPLGVYIYSNVDFGIPQAVFKSKIQLCLDAISTEGLTAVDFPLGIWLHLSGSGPTPSANKTKNFQLVKWFREVVAAKNYKTSGLFASQAYIQAYLNVSDCATVPMWLSAKVNAAGTACATKDEITTYVDPSIYAALRAKLYIWQDGGMSLAGGLVNHDWVMQEIPCIGYSNTEDDSSSPSYTGGGEPVIVPASRLWFEPPVTNIDSSTQLSIVTDADNVIISYTLDNSIPQFKTQEEADAALEELRTLPQTYPDKHIFIRARAFDKDTQEVKAKGAACYTRVPATPAGPTGYKVSSPGTPVPYLYKDSD